MRKILVAIFFFWHVFAITFPQWALPYVLYTSQWQQWNLFAPDPMWQVVHYRIDAEMTPGRWQTLHTITPASYEWWRRTAHFKLFIGLFEPGQASYHPFAVRSVLRMFCEPFGLAPRTQVRLVYLQYNISKHVNAAPWPREQFEEIGYSARCL